MGSFYVTGVGIVDQCIATGLQPLMHCFQYEVTRAV
jgi:hypothetical protein